MKWRVESGKLRMENGELEEQNAAHFEWICGRRPLFQSLLRP